MHWTATRQEENVQALYLAASMKREFFLNISILLVSNLIIKVYYLLGIDRQMQLELGAESYGLYFSLLNFTLLFQFINDFGLQNFTNRYVSQNREELHQRFQEFAVFKLLLSGLYILVVASAFQLWDPGTSHSSLLIHLAFNQVIISGIFFLRAQISGLGFYRMDSFFSVLDRMILILLGSLLLGVPILRTYLTIQGFVWIQSISLSTTLVFCVLYLRRMQGSLHWGKWHWTSMKKLFFWSAPFALIYFFGALYNKVDVVLLEKLLHNGAEKAGIYAGSLRLYEAMSMISLSFGGLLLAMFSRLYQDRKKLSGLYQLSFKWLIVGTLCVAIPACLYSPHIMDLLYHTSDPQWTRCFSWVMIAFIPASLNYIHGAFFQAMHREWPLICLYGLASMLSIGINLYVIPRWEVVGAAIVACIVHGVLFAFQAFFVWHKKLVDTDRNFISFTLVFFSLSWLLGLCIRLLEFQWFWKAGFTSVTIAGLAFAFRMINIAEMRENQKPNSGA